MPHLIYGNIAANGSITSGTGFSVSRPAGGGYRIDFNQSYSIVPTVNATLIGTGAPAGSCDNTINVEPALDHCLLHVTDLPTSGGQTEHTDASNAFCFSIIGE